MTDLDREYALISEEMALAGHQPQPTPDATPARVLHALAFIMMMAHCTE